MNILSPAFVLTPDHSISPIDGTMPRLATESCRDNLITFENIQRLDLEGLDLRIRSGKLSVTAPLSSGIARTAQSTLWVSQTIALPRDADVDRAAAFVDNGVLAIVLAQKTAFGGETISAA